MPLSARVSLFAASAAAMAMLADPLPPDAVQLYQWVINNGQNTKIKAYAIETPPVLLQHLQMTKDLQATLTGSAP